MNELEVKDSILSVFPKLSESSLQSILQHATYLECSKGTKLITEGKRHRYFYFILKGSVKSYHQKKSKEICLWFGFKNELISTINTFEGEASTETIELLEDSILYCFETQAIRELAQTDIFISHWITELIIQHAKFLEERLNGLQFLTSLERYNFLIRNAPDILQKVSLTDIASFLGVSRETISRIRGQK